MNVIDLNTHAKSTPQKPVPIKDLPNYMKILIGEALKYDLNDTAYLLEVATISCENEIEKTVIFVNDQSNNP